MRLQGTLRLAVLTVSFGLGATAAEKIAPGKIIEIRLAGGQSETLEVEAPAGYYIRASAVCEGLAVHLSLRAGDQAPVHVTGLGGTGGTATVAAVAESAATYRLEVTSPSKDPVERPVRVSVDALRPASAEDRLNAVAYRSLAAAKTPAEFDAALLQAIAANDGALSCQAALAEAGALLRSGKYWDAIKLLESRLSVASGLPDRRAEMQFHYMIGVLDIYTEQNRAAVTQLENVLPYVRQAGQLYETGSTLQNLAAANFVLGNCTQALKQGGEALEIRRRLGEPERVGYSLLAVAKAHLCLGEGQEALDTYGSALNLWRELKDVRNEAAVRNDMGVIYASLGEWDQAEASHRTALRLREQAGDVGGQAESLVNLGQVELLSKRLRPALEEYGRVLKLPPEGHERPRGYALEGRAEALFRLGEKNDVERLLRESIDILNKVGDRDGEASSWRMLGEATRSREAYARAVELERAVGDRPAQAVSLTQLAALESDAGDLTEARTSLEEALGIIETARADLANPGLRMSYLALRRGAYEQYVNVLVRLGAGRDPQLAAAAFGASERAHARTLLDELSGTATRASATAGLREIQSDVLDPGTVLLEYLLGDQASSLWLVTQTSFERYDLPPRPVLEAEARTFYEALTARKTRDPKETPAARAERFSRADAAVAESAMRLRRLLLGPVWERLQDRRVLVVGDGLLHLVPFAALGIAGETVQLPSASALVRIGRAGTGRAPGRKLLLIADPVFSAQDPRVSHGKEMPGDAPDGGLLRSASESGLAAGFPRLRLSRQEAMAIARIAPAGEAVQDLDFQASPAVLRGPSAGRFGIIHIAAHTLLNNSHPEASGIVLSLVDREGKPQDGFLRLRDIYGLHLDSRLVTLSACETAIGKDVRGEGMIGLARAFLYAGAERVVASLWKVEDAATEDFMVRFYRHMYREGMAPAAALHAVQLEMRKDPRWRAPYYWAAFTIEGDWR